MRREKRKGALGYKHEVFGWRESERCQVFGAVSWWNEALDYKANHYIIAVDMYHPIGGNRRSLGAKVIEKLAFLFQFP